MIIDAQQIFKAYRDLQVLKGIDFQVEAGEIVSIVGESGAGKSTLLHILGSLDRPDSGKVLLHGEDIFRVNDKKLAQFRNRHIGFVFQFHNLLPEFTALENVCMPAYLGNISPQKAQKKALQLMELLGIAERSHHLPSEMSGGEQQRTAIARALVNDPLVVFADEPSGNLDSKNSQELHALFLKLREELKQTFVIVTHNIELAAMSDRRVVMRDGLIFAEQHS
ncbi:MAG: ABC transporter ATP-binding protein [Microscillaceae bacterium]|nr:ABC transporter ATP-binding protein [Microscillaceae bacterium]